MAGETAGIVSRFEATIRSLGVASVVSVIEERGYDLTREIEQHEDTSVDAAGRRLIVWLKQRLDEQSVYAKENLVHGLDILEGKIALGRLTDHSGLIPIDKVTHRLIAESLLDLDDKESILQGRTASGRGVMLLDAVEKKSRYSTPVGKGVKVLYRSLVEVGALHLAKVLLPQERIVGDDDPRKYELMTEEHKDLLIRNRVKLMETIDVAKLMPRLTELKQLDEHDRQVIESEKTKYAQAVKLMDIIVTKSDFAFTTFVSALQSGGNRHLVGLLDKAFKSAHSEAADAYIASAYGEDAGLVHEERQHERQEMEPGMQSSSEVTSDDLVIDTGTTGRPSLAVFPIQRSRPTAPALDPSDSQHLIQQPAACYSTAIMPASGDSTDAMHDVVEQIDDIRRIELADALPEPTQERVHLLGATPTASISTSVDATSHVYGTHEVAANGRRPEVVVSGRPAEVAVPRGGQTSSQPDDTLVEDLSKFLEVVDARSWSEWTYKVLWVVSTPEDCSAVMTMLNEHANVHNIELSHDLVRSLQYHVKLIYIDQGNIKKAIILVTQQKPGQDHTALACSHVLEKCSTVHMAVMSGTCSGMRSKTELGDIVLADSAFTTEFRSTIISKTERRSETEMESCPAVHLAVLKARLQESGSLSLWQREGICNRPKTTKEYQLLFLSRVLIELASERRKEKWLKSFGLKLDEELLSDHNSRALQCVCPTWPEFYEEAEECEEWVEDNREDAPYGLKPCARLEKEIKQSIRKDPKYPAKMKINPDYKCAPMFSSSSTRHDEREVFDEALNIKHSCIAVDSGAAKFYEIARELLGGKPVFVAKGVSDFADGKLKDDAFETYSRQISAVFLLDVIRMFAKAEERNEQQNRTKPYTDL